MKSADTIFALSSGAPPSGVAVVRVSGPAVRDVLEGMAGGVPAERVAELRTIYDAEGNQLDRGLVLFFAGQRSFVGEDSAEFHLHGGKAVVAAVLAALRDLPGLRAAEAGEFTRRAFMNGKIDLLEAEALADLVRAETEFQRRFAQSNAGAAQAVLYAGWRERLVRARALLEATVDFSDEEDVPGDASGRVWSDLAVLAGEISAHLAAFGKAEIIREGFDVVIVGPPNAGKSSLLNRLAERDVAIVTDEAGTTRDLVEVALDLDGMKVRLTDTAGIRQPTGKVEALGIERAQRRAREADLVLVLHPADAGAGQVLLGEPPARTVGILSKSDLARGPSRGMLAVSAATGEGLPELLDLISTAAREAADVAGQVVPTRLRHVECLIDAEAWLRRALAGQADALELRAEELRLAANALGRISGAIGVEDMLDVIFGEFCIGK